MGDRRTRGEGSIYQRESDGRWIGVVDLGWVGGKRVRKTVSAPTLTALRPKFKRLKQQIEANVITDETTVAAWMATWLDTVAAEKLRPSTMKSYRGYVDTWIVPHLGKHRLDRLKPDHIRALYAEMKKQGKADATRRQVHAILRRALVVAERDGKIASNPAAKVDAPAVGQGSHGKFTIAEALVILDALGERPIVEQARWSLALLEALRQGEALGLMWADIDLADGYIRVERAAQRIKGEGVKIVPLKSQSSYRFVPLLPPVRAILEAMPSGEGFIFGEGGKLMDPRRDWADWKALLEVAGVPHRPLHAARATTASLLSEAGVSDKTIAEILGHSQVQITQRHYIHGDAVSHRDAMGKLNTMLNAARTARDAESP